MLYLTGIRHKYYSTPTICMKLKSAANSRANTTNATNLAVLGHYMNFLDLKSKVQINYRTF